MTPLIGIIAILLSTNAYGASRGGLSEYERAVKATVMIMTVKPGTDEVLSRASGVFVNEKGWILTNRHVIFDGAKFRELVIAPMGSDERPDSSCLFRVLAGNVIPGIANDDAALIIPQSKDLKCVVPAYVIPTNAVPKTRTAIVALGYPGLDVGGDSLTVTEGTIAGQVVQDGRLTYLKIDAAIGPGSSGGPVIDAKGQLLGLAAAATQIKIAQGVVQELVGLIVPSATILESFPELNPQGGAGQTLSAPGASRALTAKEKRLARIARRATRSRSSSSAASSRRGQVPSNPPAPQGYMTPCMVKAWECIVNSPCARKTGTQTQKCTLIDKSCSNPNRAQPKAVIACLPLEGQLKKMQGIIDYGEKTIQLMGEQTLQLSPQNFEDAKLTRNQYKAKLDEYKGMLEGIYKYINFLQLFRDAIDRLEIDLTSLEKHFFDIPGTSKPTIP